ncbi:MAG TPA: MFS transporter [Tahibacter sp.]|nr:MFS transporter [Tahibacter sp.]
MSSPNQFALLRSRRFGPFFWTQALGAFNDNVFKNALVILVVYQIAVASSADSAFYTNLAAGLFILPFLLFSATSGQLSDKYDKARIAQWVKVLELVIMIVALPAFLWRSIPLLMTLLFLMGLHSTIFGPLKYGLLPQVLDERELVGGNGLIEMATFLAILLGQNLGATLIAIPDTGAWYVGAATILTALVGLGCALMMPKVASPAPDLRINWNPLTETWNNLKYIRGNRAVFLSCLGISWFWFFGSVFITQLPSYAKDVIGGDAGVYTFLLTVFSLGIGIGSLLCERLSGHKVEIGLVPFGSIGMTLFGVDMYFAKPDLALEHGLHVSQLIAQPWVWRVLVDIFAMAVFSGFFIVPLFALIQTRSDPARRSRVIAANNILNALFMVVAAGLSAALLGAAGLSIPGLLLATALMNAVVAIYIYTLVPEFLMRFLSWILVNTLYRIRLDGLERIPETGPALLVCNHVSYMDALIIGGSVRRPVRFVMYYKIFNIPVLSFIFRTAKAIPIAGSKEDPELLAKAFDAVDATLAEGELVCIFPEGGLTRDGDIAPFRSGVEKILERRPVPVVPLALRGLWGSVFSRRDTALGRSRLPRRFWSKIGLAASDPVPAAEATAEILEAKVKTLRGDWA